MPKNRSSLPVSLFCSFYIDDGLLCRDGSAIYSSTGTIMRNSCGCGIHTDIWFSGRISGWRSMHFLCIPFGTAAQTGCGADACILQQRRACFSVRNGCVYVFRHMVCLGTMGNSCCQRHIGIHSSFREVYCFRIIYRIKNFFARCITLRCPCYGNGLRLGDSVSCHHHIFETMDTMAPAYYHTDCGHWTFGTVQWVLRITFHYRYIGKISPLLLYAGLWRNLCIPANGFGDRRTFASLLFPRKNNANCVQFGPEHCCHISSMASLLNFSSLIHTSSEENAK